MTTPQREQDRRAILQPGAHCLCSHNAEKHLSALDGECVAAGCSCRSYRPKNAAVVPCACSHSLAEHDDDLGCDDSECDCTAYRAPTRTEGARPMSVQPITPTPTAQSAPTAEQLLAAGKRSDVKSITSLAYRIDTQLEDLRCRLAANRDAAQARAEVKRLEEQLAAAKAKLRTDRTPPSSKSKGDGICPECGKTGLSNVGAHRSRAHGLKAG